MMQIVTVPRPSGCLCLLLRGFCLGLGFLLAFTFRMGSEAENTHTHTHTHANIINKYYYTHTTKRHREQKTPQELFVRHGEKRQTKHFLNFLISSHSLFPAGRPNMVAHTFINNNSERDITALLLFPSSAWEHEPHEVSQ